MKSTSICCFTLILLVASPCFAELQLRIVSIPTEVPILTPAPVVIATENVGPDPLLVPVNYRGSHGYRVSITLNGVEQPYMTSGPDYGLDTVVWLQSGEQYFVHDDVSYRIFTEGEYVIRVTLESTGTCRQAGGNPDIPKGLLIEDRAGLFLYRCWSGEIESHEQNILIRKPKTKLDQEALTYIEARPFPKLGMKFVDAYEYLKESFPGSTYTFAAAFHRGTLALREMVRPSTRQPSKRICSFCVLISGG